MHKNLILFVILSLMNVSAFAQQAIVELETDDTLPIASQRYDDAIEPPKDNFSSVGKSDMWERFERGELDQKAFMKLQETYQAEATNSKDPYVKRKIASDARQKKHEAAKKAKEEKLAKIATDKKMAKLAKQKNTLEADMEMEAKIKATNAAAAAKAPAKSATKAAPQKRAPASTKKALPKKLPAKKK